MLYQSCLAAPCVADQQARFRKEKVLSDLFQVPFCVVVVDHGPGDVGDVWSLAEKIPVNCAESPHFRQLVRNLEIRSVRLRQKLEFDPVKLKYQYDFV